MRIGVVTGSRADRGPLQMVYETLKDAPEAHTVQWINVEPSKDFAHTRGAVPSAALATLVAGSALKDMEADLAVMLGDRYEILGAATAANLLNIPIAHLSGGDVSEGAFDDNLRHAITKLASLHFPTHKRAADRIIAMGEDREAVHIVGCPGIDRMLATKLVPHREAMKAVGLRPYNKYLLVTFQPATRANAAEECRVLLKVLGEFSTYGIVFTSVNNDPGGGEIERMIKGFCLLRPEHRKQMPDMEAGLYFSLMRGCEVMIGNSSSGFYEAPVFHKRFVNVGERQRGRLAPLNVLSAPAVFDMIYSAITQALTADPISVPCPYGDGHAAERIAAVIGRIDDPSALVRKTFHEPHSANGRIPSSIEGHP